MNNHLSPGPECAQFAELLPVLDDIAGPEAVAARAHLNTCAWCQAQQRVDIRLEAALRRSFGPAATPRLSTEDIMASLSDNDQSSHQTPSRVPLRSRGVVSGAAALAAVVLLALLANAVFAGHHPARSPSAAATAPIVPTPLPTQPPGTNFTQDTLRGISMVSPSEGWAVGSHGVYTVLGGPDESGYTAALLDHFINGSWQAVATGLPQPGPQRNASLDDISMVNAHDGWAVGTQPSGTQDQFMLLLHYDGTHWTRYPTTLQGELVAVQMISANEGWALSGGLPTTHPVILHYRNGAWTVQYTLPTASSQGNGTLNQLSMVSADEGWAVGTTYVLDSKGNGIPSAVFLHYQHGAWKIQQSFPHGSLVGISMDSATDGWAVGLGSGNGSTAYHYENGAWHLVPGAIAPIGTGPNAGVSVAGIHMNSATDGWVGVNDNYQTPQSLYLYHFDGAGWHRITLSIPGSDGPMVGAITFLPDGEGWAAGMVGLPQSATGPAYTIRPLILHYVNGSWSVQQS